ncbi:MAG: type II secretion system major pseudopilin GspG [Syntrophobacteria bacterium]
MSIGEVSSRICRRFRMRPRERFFSLVKAGVKDLNPCIPFKILFAACGFTLIEIMVVIIILGILAGLIVPRFMEEPEKARAVKAKMQIESLSMALKKYKLDTGDYPTTEQGLEALVEKPAIGKIPKKYPEKGYIPKIPKDPWGNEYVYISPGEHGDFDIISYGADGEEGGEGKDADVRSWEIE